MFDVLPSEEDYAAAEKEVNEMAEEFSQSTTPMQYATLNSQAQTVRSMSAKISFPARWRSTPSVPTTRKCTVP